MADGEIFNTITHGKNTMMAYGPNVTVARSLGDHLLICARCNAARTRRGGCAAEHRADLDKPAETNPTDRRRKEMSERSHDAANAGRRIFRERTALPGLSLLLGVIAFVGLGL